MTYYLSGMAGVRDLIRAKIEERGLTMGGLSKEVLGKNHAYLQQYLERGVPRRLPEDVRALLADALGLQEGQLREPSKGFPVPHSSKSTSPPATIPPPNAVYAPDTWPRDLPVMGTAECGPDGFSVFNGEVIQMAPRPSNLAGVPKAYAVYAQGDSMNPRYHAGELLHIHPAKPVTPGDYVLVQIRPDQDGDPPRAIIKRLVRRTEKKVFLEQFNPPKIMEVKTGDVLSIHRVVGSSET